MTRGRRLLIALLQITTAREIAARCRVSPMCVSYWVSGDRTPDPAHCAKIAAIYGIPPAAWRVLYKPPALAIPR